MAQLTREEMEAEITDLRGKLARVTAEREECEANRRQWAKIAQAYDDEATALELAHDKVKERAMALERALLGVDERVLPDGTPCYCADVAAEGHDSYCAEARAVLLTPEP